MHVAGGRARRDAAFRVCTAVGTGDYAVPLDLMQRLDPQRLLRVAHSAPESLKRRAFTKIDGAVTEVRSPRRGGLAPRSPNLLVDCVLFCAGVHVYGSRTTALGVAHEAAQPSRLWRTLRCRIP